MCFPKIGDKHNSKGKEFKVIPYGEWKSQMNGVNGGGGGHTVSQHKLCGIC